MRPGRCRIIIAVHAEVAAVGRGAGESGIAGSLLVSPACDVHGL